MPASKANSDAATKMPARFIQTKTQTRQESFLPSHPEVIGQCAPGGRVHLQSFAKRQLVMRPGDLERADLCLRHARSPGEQQLLRGRLGRTRSSPDRSTRLAC